MTAAQPNKLLDVEFYLNAAEKHGADSEPDHEVGDLQDLMRALYERLTDSQRAAFAKDPHVHRVLEGASVDFEEELAKLR
jgi:hypothetical protein